MVSRHWREEVKRRFRRLRLDVEKSQVDIELEADLPRGKYWRIENGVDEPSSEERIHLARALKVDITAIPLLSERESRVS
jgi:transcriptional regulator with XRE-family HTH domain